MLPEDERDRGGHDRNVPAAPSREDAPDEIPHARRERADEHIVRDERDDRNARHKDEKQPPVERERAAEQHRDALAALEFQIERIEMPCHARRHRHGLDGGRAVEQESRQPYHERRFERVAQKHDRRDARAHRPPGVRRPGVAGALRADIKAALLRQQPRKIHRSGQIARENAEHIRKNGFQKSLHECDPFADT